MFSGFGGKSNSASKLPRHETTKYNAMQSRGSERKSTLFVIGNKKGKQCDQIMKNEQKELSLTMTEQGLTLRLNV